MCAHITLSLISQEAEEGAARREEEHKQALDAAAASGALVRLSHATLNGLGPMFCAAFIEWNTRMLSSCSICC